MTTLSLRDAGLRATFDRAIRDGKISQADVGQLIESTQDGAGLSKTERADLEKLLARSDLFDAGAQGQLAAFLGVPPPGGDGVSFKDAGLKAAAQQLCLQDSISVAEAQALLDAAADGQGLSKTERTDLYRLLSQAAGRFAPGAKELLLQALEGASPSAGTDLRFDDAGLRAVAEQRGLTGPIGLADVEALLASAADGRGLSKTERADLTRLLDTVGDRLRPEARQHLQAALGLLDNPPAGLPDPFPDLVFNEHDKLAKLDELLRRGAQRAEMDKFSGVTTWSNPKSQKIYFGEGWVAQRFDVTATHKMYDALIMAHPATGDVRYMTGPAVATLLEKSEAFGGRTQLEVLGNPKSRKDYQGSFSFDHGNAGTRSSGGWPATTVGKVDLTTDAATRLAELDATPSNAMPLAEAAALLKGAFGTVARAVDDLEEPVITRKDLELLALESDAPAELQAAARSILGQDLFNAVDVAAGKRFPDDRISVEALDAVLDPSQVPARTRALEDLSMFALDYMDTSGPNATPLGRDRRLSLTVWAAPGAEINVYNRNAPDGAEPARIFTHAVPVDAGGANAKGLVRVQLSIPKDADWFMGDTLALTQKMGTRDESVPLEIRVSGKGGGYRRPVTLNPDQVTTTAEGRVKSTGDFTVTPYTVLQLAKDGVDTGVAVQADAYGRFSFQLPADVDAGAWELRHGYRQNAVRVPLAGSALVDVQARAQAWVDSVQDALFTPLDGSHFRHRLTGVEPGWSVTVQNPGAGANQTFTADEHGVLDIDLGNVAQGDTLTVTLAAQPMVDHSFPETKLIVTLPTPEQAARAQAVLDALQPATTRERFLALELFGPHSSVDAWKTETDPARMRELFEGAQLGLYLKGHRFLKTLPKMQQKLEAAGRTHVVEGFTAVQGMKSGHTPTDPASIGLTWTRQDRQIWDGSRMYDMTFKDLGRFEVNDSGYAGQQESWLWQTRSQYVFGS